VAHLRVRRDSLLRYLSEVKRANRLIDHYLPVGVPRCTGWRHGVHGSARSFGSITYPYRIVPFSYRPSR